MGGGRERQKKENKMKSSESFFSLPFPILQFSLGQISPPGNRLFVNSFSSLILEGVKINQKGKI